MKDSREPPAETETNAAPLKQAPMAYQPPVLVCVGSLRDLVGKSGSSGDASPPFCKV